jgi:hypothetical protein
MASAARVTGCSSEVLPARPCVHGFCESHAALGAFDSVLAAVALNQRVEALVSAERAFGEVAGLRWVDPATPELDRLISR